MYKCDSCLMQCIDCPSGQPCLLQSLQTQAAIINIAAQGRARTLLELKIEIVTLKYMIYFYSESQKRVPGNGVMLVAKSGAFFGPSLEITSTTKSLHYVMELTY